MLRLPIGAPSSCGCGGARSSAAPAAAQVAPLAALTRAPAPLRAPASRRCARVAAVTAASGDAPAPPPPAKRGFGGKAASAAAAAPPLPRGDGCPCGSGAAYAACCGPYHAGTAVEPTAEAVLRARFSAYAKGGQAAVDYIVASTHPRSPDAARAGEPGSAEALAQLRKDAAATMANTAFQKLTVVRCDKGANELEEWVTFRATYERRDADTPRFKQRRWRDAEATKALSEKGRFLKNSASGRWCYFGGTLLSPTDLGAYDAPA